SERSARPRALEFEVLHAVSRFVRGNPATVVLVDDVDLLVRTVGFEAVARFLHRLNNLSTGRGSTTIAALDPDALPADQVTLLRRDRERPVVFVADIEQLRLFAPFPRVVEFVKGLIDQVAIRDGVLLASVEPKGIEAQELACLRRRFDVVRKL